MPIRQAPYEFNQFPPVFEGLLPEGIMLEAMLRREKIDKKDLFKQLVTIGEDVVGSLRIEEIL
jgi:serine/threonine-protein kinase HipA